MQKFKEPVSIEVNGREELKKVLEKLEKMGYVWHGGGKPTDIKWLNPKREVTAIDIKFKGNLSFSANGYILPNTKRISAKEFLAHKNECIVIYRKGTDTIALDKSTGKKEVAKLHPDDEYDFNVGAQLAFDRLVGREQAPAEQPKEEFKPYLALLNHRFYGYMGEETLIKDAIGRLLRVGDTVELYNRNNKYKGERVICKDMYGKYFVMGIRLDCNKDGTIRGWKIIKKRNYEDIQDREIVDGVQYIKEK